MARKKVVKPKKKVAKKKAVRAPKASAYEPYYPRGGKKRDVKERFIHKRTGEKISKRAYYTLKRGGISNEKLSASRREGGIPNKMGVFNSVLSDYQRSLSFYGINRSRDDIRKSPGFKKMLSYLRSGDRAPGGKMSIALQALGRRPPDASYAVGDTPRLVKRRRR